MTSLKVLPARPSLASIRKQAKTLARDIAAGNADAIARARAQLPNAELPLSQRDTQLVLAREYGFAGWQDLKGEVLKCLGNGPEWAAARAHRAIHDNDVQCLKLLVAEFPALLSWRDDSGHVLLQATTSYAIDSRDPEIEQLYNRPACAELLLDAGAVIEPPVWQQVIATGAAGMLQLLWRKGVLPRTLPILAALGDIDAVRACFDDSGPLRRAARPGNADNLVTVNEAFMNACRFNHGAVAAMLLDRCIALDEGLGREIERWTDRATFVERLGPPFVLSGHGTEAPAITPWRVFVMHDLGRAIGENDLSAFARWLQSQSWLLDASSLDFQITLLEHAAFHGREAFMVQLLDLDPALLHRRPRPRSKALVLALEYGKAHVVPLLTRIWPLPDDLPHAAGTGDFARVKRWFDAAGQPAFGNPNDHYCGSSPSNVQRTLDVALAWSCVNRQFEIAAFLLAHGADINTDWSSHEPASILHECAYHNNFEAVAFLIEHGIDLDRRDQRYGDTAEEWARHGAGNEEMADFLAAARQQQKGSQ
jgi:hypothetical protein